MRTDLKRIETALSQLNSRDISQPIPKRRTSIFKKLSDDAAAFSFRITPTAGEKAAHPGPTVPSASPPPATAIPLSLVPVVTPDSQIIPPSAASIIPESHPPQPSLSGSLGRVQGANPALALSLLKEIESSVVGWQTELKQLLAQIQSLYQEGPIIDGWLEAVAAPASPDLPRLPARFEGASSLDVASLPTSAYGTPSWDDTAIATAPAPRYCLCGPGVDGQIWRRPCPPEQIPQISVAIARYQKLRQLLHRKKELESRLTHLVRSLVDLHGAIQ